MRLFATHAYVHMCRWIADISGVTLKQFMTVKISYQLHLHAISSHPIHMCWSDLDLLAGNRIKHRLNAMKLHGYDMICLSVNIDASKCPLP